MTVHNYQPVKRYVTRRLPCRSCGKIVSRNFVGECTVNPFNKNAAGEICSTSEVAQQSMGVAERAANKAQADGVECRECEDKPNREALLAFANGVPLSPRSREAQTLLDRGNVKEIYEHKHCAECGHTNWTLTGYELTPLGHRVVDKHGKRATA